MVGLVLQFLRMVAAIILHDEIAEVVDRIIMGQADPSLDQLLR